MNAHVDYATHVSRAPGVVHGFELGGFAQEDPEHPGEAFLLWIPRERTLVASVGRGYASGIAACSLPATALARTCVGVLGALVSEAAANGVVLPATAAHTVLHAWARYPGGAHIGSYPDALLRLSKEALDLLVDGSGTTKSMLNKSEDHVGKRAEAALINSAQTAYSWLSSAASHCIVGAGVCSRTSPRSVTCEAC